MKVAELIKNLVRNNDFIIRWGGEEFLIILNKTKVEYLTVFSKKVLDLIRETPIELAADKIVYTTCSIGCVSIPFRTDLTDLLTLEQAINISDFAMYKAKERGRNRAVHINCKESVNYPGENLKKYLLGLTKESDIDEEILTVKEIK